MSILAMTAILLHGRYALRGPRFLLFAIFAFAHGPAMAASFAVNSVADARDANAGDGICATSSGVCSLRAAIEESNALAGADTISLNASTYLVTLGNGDDKAERGDLDITDSVTIIGSGEAFTVIDGNAVDRVFDVHENAGLDMSAVTVRNGNINKEGGGIRNEGTLVLTDVTISDNVGKNGGGVSVRKNGSTAIFTNVTFIRNFADKGGGIHAKDDTTVTISGSAFRSNSASKDGGGIFFDKTVARISGSVFFGNNAEKGGGLFVKGGAGDVAITNTTISGNSASKEGGGLHKDGNGAARLTNVTVYNNNSPRGGGLRGKKGTLSLFNTIVANNLIGSDCDGTITSLGNNLASDGSCQLTQTGDLPSTDPLVGPLQDNGGSTLTHDLSDPSPARDAGANLGCPGADQRGMPRPVDSDADNVATCDIGALEAGPLYPDYNLNKTVVTLSDPFSGSSDPKAIPGAIVQYTISLSNDGPGAADQDTIEILEAVPLNTSLVVLDFDVSNPGPVAFIDGIPASGLSYSFIDLASAADDIEFSDDGGATYGYIPTPTGDGSDPNVTHIRINPTGFAQYTGADPVAEFLFKAIVR